MFEEGVQVSIGGREYRMVYTLAAMRAIKKQYGGIGEMAEKFNGPAIEDWDDETVRAEKKAAQEKAQYDTIDEIPWLICVLVNQGELLRDPKAELIKPESLEVHIMPRDVGTLMSAAMQAINIGLGTEHPPDGGKRDPVLEELDTKNVAGAEGK